MMKRLLAFAVACLLSVSAHAQLAQSGAGKKPSAGGGGSVAYRGTSSATSVSACGTQPATITGQTNGDLIYGQWVGHNGAAFSGAATGWTTLDQSTDPNTGNVQYIAYKKVTGTNDSFAPTCTGTSDSYTWSFSGVNSTTPTEQFTLTQVANQTTWTTATATPTFDNSAHVVSYTECSNPNSPTTPPAGYTQIQSNHNGCHFSAYYKLLGAGTAGVGVTAAMVWNGAGYGPMWTAIARP